MTRWTHTLPAAIEAVPQVHAAYALGLLVDAMGRDHAAISDALRDVQYAAAHLRAWRQSLPGYQQGEREWSDHDLTRTDRGLIRAAILRVCWADAGDEDQGEHLRAAEARLRVLGKRLMARSDA